MQLVSYSALPACASVAPTGAPCATPPGVNAAYTEPTRASAAIIRAALPMRRRRRERVARRPGPRDAGVSGGEAVMTSPWGYVRRGAAADQCAGQLLEQVDHREQ